MKLSVVIITLNAADIIERCINSVRWVADEILVVDSYSKDFTTHIASSSGARVLQHEFSDYVSQRNFAVAQARYDWVLCIDADEALSRDLQMNIKATLMTAEFECYELRRRNNYCGHWMRFGSLHTCRQLRLFNRTKGKWQGNLINECWRPFQSNLPIGKLDGYMYHYPISSWDSYQSKTEYQTELLARASFEAGRNYGILALFFLPVFYFIKDYFFKLAFLDYKQGYYAAKMYAFQKYRVIKKVRSSFKYNLQEPVVFSKN